MQDNSKTRVKTKRAITDRYALSLKPHVRLSTPLTCQPPQNLISCLSFSDSSLFPAPGPGAPPTLHSLHLNLENISDQLLPHSFSGHFPRSSQNWGCSLCHLVQTRPFSRPKRLGFPSSGRNDKAPCPWTEAFSSPGLGCRPRQKASALSETEAGPGTTLCGKKGALTLLETAVNLFVLQQFLAVVLKRLISRVRHDEKPSLIGDAGNGHGRPGGGRGGAREESLPGKAGSQVTPPLPVGSSSAFHFNFCA